MITLRCTQRVLRRFRLQAVESPPASTGALGDWYANLLDVGRTCWVLCMSERSLLPVLVPARNDCFPSGLSAALLIVLERLGIEADAAAREASACETVTFARTRSRVVLGAMNDFATVGELDLHRVVLRGATPAEAALQTALELAEMPSRPIGRRHAAQLARELLAAGTPS
jgi:hypothetical protein